MTDIDQLKNELQWYIANNEDRPRTESALRWALEVAEDIKNQENTKTCTPLT